MTVRTDAPISVAALVDEHVAALEEPREPDGKWHPSSYWGACDRKIIYELRGVERSNPPGPRSKRIFRIGHLLHEFIQGALATAPEIAEFYPEFEITSKLEETGHGDALMVFDDGTAAVLEIKSINSKGFFFLKDEPKPENAAQGQTYAVHARNDGVWVDDPAAEGGKRFIPPLGDRVTGVLVVYFDKDTLHIREFWLPYDTAWEQKVEDRIAHLETYRADPESLPPRQKTKSKFPCSWKDGQCDFFTRCWSDVDGPGSEPAGETDVPAVFEW
jgi:hypothetical protein